MCGFEIVLNMNKINLLSKPRKFQQKHKRCYSL